jgi:hypothetical protein
MIDLTSEKKRFHHGQSFQGILFWHHADILERTQGYTLRQQKPQPLACASNVKTTESFTLWLFI